MERFDKIDDDRVSNTYDVTRTIDLRDYKKRLLEIRDRLKSIPQQKTEPDEETLRFWNEMFADKNEIDALKDQANYLINDLKKVYQAGQLPEKWVKPLKEFNDWLKGL